MSDIIQLISAEGDAAVDQIIIDAGRLHTVVNGDGTTSAVTEDGSQIPSIRKALLDNFYFKTPIIPWVQGTQVRDYNQLYSFTSGGVTNWWYAPTASTSAPITQGASPQTDARWRVFVDSSNLDGIYAPLNSPNFTGNPRVPTPAAEDSSTSVANTGWVKTAVAAAIAAALPSTTDGVFTNLQVTNNTVLNNLYATGQVTLTGTQIDAVDATMSLAGISLVGSAAVIDFLWSESGKRRTNITPTRVYTEEVSANTTSTNTLTVGQNRATSTTLTVNGNASINSLVLNKNISQPTEQDTLTVQSGVTRVQDLIIEGDVTGITSNIDGSDIAPKSINNETSISTTTLTVSGDSAFGTSGGVSRFQGDVEFLGDVRGLDTGIEGKNLRLGNLTLDGDLLVEGSTNLQGATTLGDVTFTGAISGLVYPDPSVDGLDIKPKSVEVTEDLSVGGLTTVKDLMITGTVQGMGEFSIDGQDVKPASVETTGDVTVGGQLILQGGLVFEDVNAGDITTNTIEIAQKITATGATIEGFGGVVNGESITPANVTISENLNVQGTTSLGNTSFTGTVTGLSPDFGEEEIKGGSLTVDSVSTGTLTASTSISTEDITVKGRILDAAGEDFALQVSAEQIGNAIQTLDIQPKSVTTKTSETDKGYVNTGKLIADEVDANTADIETLELKDGTVTGTLQVMGEILDSEGNPIATMDIPGALAGKNINPNNVTADGNITANNGSISSETASVTGALSVGSVHSSGLILSDEGISAGGNLSAGANLTVTGNATIQGTANITGTTTVSNLVVTGGITDGNGNPLDTVASITGKDIAPKDVASTGEVSAISLSISENATVSGAVTAGSVSTNGAVDAASLSTSGAIQVGSGITVTGDSEVGGDSIVTGNLYVTESTTLGHIDPEFEGERLTIYGDQRVNGNVYVTGLINGNVDISGQDINPRSISATSDITLAGELTAPVAGITNLTVGTSGSATGLTVNNSATISGNLTVNGTINATIDQSNQDVVTNSLETGNITAETLQVGSVTATGNVTTAGTVGANSVEASKFMVTPKVETLTTGVYLPDGTTNAYDITVTLDTRIDPPSGLLTSGKAASILIYITQDATGGHAVTFSSEYQQLGEGDINTNSGGVTVVQLMYIGRGGIIDTLISPRS